MVLRVSWEQALGWRMQRQLLDPIGQLPVEEVVRRLGGVQAQVASSAELAVRVRRDASRPGEVARALSDGLLIKTWAMRGTLHLLTPEEGGAFLSLIASGRTWELPSWQRYFGMRSEHWDLLRGTVRNALANGPLTRDDLVAAIIAERQLAHLHDELRSGWGTLFKPLAWQGELCFGPSRGNRATFMRPADASSRWADVPDPAAAAPIVIASYLRAYGPATVENLRNWLARGRIPVRRLRAWFAAMADRIVEVDVDGTRLHVLAEDVDQLLAARPSAAVRLLPAFDQYVLGPGTEDGRVIPAVRRPAVSRQAGWISPVVVVGGVVRGTWELAGDRVPIAWFGEAGRPPLKALRSEVARLSAIVDRDLISEVTRT
jgi:hypothetical protein